MKKIIMLCLLFTGCASTPATQFYLLEALNQPQPIINNNEAKLLIGVGPLTLPSVLERKQIVTRSNNAVQLSEFNQWAEPLNNNILSVLVKNLAAFQPNALIKAFPWAAYGEVNYRVIIDISRFDAELGKTCQLEAGWAIMREKDHRIIKNGQVKLSEPLHDMNYSSLVGAMNQLLNQFSQQVSLALKTVL